ncbi:vanadium-dependent haloperoxidase [Pseudanabaena sp. PCC 6802]|uniref:vanadium-dependent haloperoxidase n=1 Tax=Pseudanabaena sp. PCC 6802 TaxID=118173 RepID=UPI00034564CD|nr:vanadium-dependent haloperoxidase [Pseudanabaena sp. PCC 6802]
MSSSSIFAACYSDRAAIEKESNIVLDWNKIALEAIRVDKTAPPIAARNLAMQHAAIFDAVNAITKTATPYLSNLSTPAGTSMEAAVTSAAHRVLVNLYPGQTISFDTARQNSLDLIPESFAKSDGIKLGETVASQILAARSNDGSKQQISYAPLGDPGKWQPTPPTFQAALLPQWPQVKPFAMTSGSQFRPSGTPALTSAEYATEFNQVKDLGAKNSPSRTPEQTKIALFWSDGPGTYTPPGHWNQIAAVVADRRDLPLPEQARLFALLNMAMADSAIAAWDAKYTYNSWRPITAIRQADLDNNPATIADPTWDSLIATPPFPEYISGHSTFSGAADAILSNFFGDNANFTIGSLGLPGATRSFQSFSHAADEAGMSRIYGGIHFLSADLDGLAVGHSLGNYVFDNFLTNLSVI